MSEVEKAENQLGPNAELSAGADAVSAARQTEKLHRLPPANFAGFIAAMLSQAHILLGAQPDPVAGKPRISLEEAKFTIDLLQVIKDKTTGNLTPEEQRLLDAALYDLRMRYVSLAR